MHELFSKQKNPLPCPKNTAGGSPERKERSDDTLSHHGLCDLQETGDVRTDHQVARLAALDGSIVAGLEDVLHNPLEALINLVKAPAETHGVLCHFKTGGGYAAGVGGFAGAVEQTALLNKRDGLGSQRHVRTLEDGHAAVVDESLGALLVHLILRCAGVGDVALDIPDVAAAGMILRAGNFVRIDGDTGTPFLLDVEELLQVNTVRVIDIALGVGHSNDLAAKLRDLLRTVLGNVAGTGDDDGLPLITVVSEVLESLGGEIAQAVTGCLRTGERSAEGQTFASEDAALEAVNDPLVLAVHIADFTATDTDVACRGVRELADVAIELGHEALAETHDFRVGLAFRIKVGTALAAAHREGGQGVLQNLLKPKELHDGEVDGGVETNAAFVGADGAVVLHTVTAVDMYFAVVIHPGNTEFQNSLGLNKTLNQSCLFPLGMLVDYQLKRFKHFFDRLKKLRFMGVAFLNLGINPLQIIVRKHKSLLVKNR